MYDINAQWYRFTVTTTAVVTVTATAPPANGYGAPNQIEVSVWTPDAEASIKDTTKSSGTVVADSATLTPTKSLAYKVLPGTYFLRGYKWTSGKNGYGRVTVTAEPVADDPGGEPNEPVINAKPVALGTAHTGTINYYGKQTPEGGYTADWHDYYAFTVPANTYGIDLTFTSRVEPWCSRPGKQLRHRLDLHPPRRWRRSRHPGIAD
jgi:hypothetical protein